MTDERDLGDPALRAAWRAQSGEAPPAALDDAILAAAHRAVKSAPAKISPGGDATRPWRWWAPLAAAATIGVIAIGALQVMPQEHDATTAVVSNMPANAPAPVGAIRDRKVEARENAIAPASELAAPAQAAPQSTLKSAPVAAMEAAPLMAKRALGDAAIAPATSPRTADEWIASIRTLMIAGNMAEANRALTDFRAAYRDADARLPADLRPWAATVPR